MDERQEEGLLGERGIEGRRLRAVADSRCLTCQECAKAAAAAAAQPFRLTGLVAYPTPDTLPARP